MLAKKHRLNLSLEKNASIFERGNSKIFSSDYFLAYIRKNEPGLQISCLTPKAALSKAALRNFYRRLMYSLVEEKIKDSTLALSSKIDLVIVLKRKFPEDKDKLKNDFSVLIDKIKSQIG